VGGNRLENSIIDILDNVVREEDEQAREAMLRLPSYEEVWKKQQTLQCHKFECEPN
jgi:hypothetical protein